MMSTLRKTATKTNDPEEEIVDSGIAAGPKVVHVRPNDDYSLTITFKTGEVKRFDVSPYLNSSEFFGELSDFEYFRKAFPDGAAVEWPHGQSFCSDMLYPRGVDINE